jgi:hydroxymethylbilane synthase
MSYGRTVRIGARGSTLSLIQARSVQTIIAGALGVDIADREEVERAAPISVITTSGDRVRDRRLLEIGGKALFLKEIEEALLQGEIDCAVHSMKDVPSTLPEGLIIAATPRREDGELRFQQSGEILLSAQKVDRETAAASFGLEQGLALRRAAQSHIAF